MEDYFDYWCPKCKNYVLLERNKYNRNILEGRCALCGKDISMLHWDWEIYDKDK